MTLDLNAFDVKPAEIVCDTWERAWELLLP
ncbi:hypothetical protein FHY35_002150 [Xanthomonas arboricola]|nr:hypothetical protein [Xanthomonas arboricola]